MSHSYWLPKWWAMFPPSFFKSWQFGDEIRPTPVPSYQFNRESTIFLDPGMPRRWRQLGKAIALELMCPPRPFQSRSIIHFLWKLCCIGGKFRLTYVAQSVPAWCFFFSIIPAWGRWSCEVSKASFMWIYVRPQLLCWRKGGLAPRWQIRDYEWARNIWSFYTSLTYVKVMMMGTRLRWLANCFNKKRFTVLRIQTLVQLLMNT